MQPQGFQRNLKHLHCAHYSICGQAGMVDQQATRFLCSDCVQQGRELPKYETSDLFGQRNSEPQQLLPPAA